MQIFVYRWTDLITNKMYIGVHKGSTNDGYVCSSKVMLPIYRERPVTFKREILFECENYDEALDIERDILTSVDAARNPLYYNMYNGRGSAFNSTKPKSPSHKENIAKAHLGKKRSDTHRHNLKIAQRKRFANPSEREKSSLSKLGNKNCVGRVLSEETKLKISNSQKRRLAGT